MKTYNTKTVEEFWLRAKDAARTADAQILDRVEVKHAALTAKNDLIVRINADNLHEEVSFGKPVGKEEL